MARKKIRRASGYGARLALQFEASELAHNADSARSGFVPGWHVVSVRRARAIGPGCKAVHARPVAAVLAARGHGEAAACKDGAHALVGVHWLIIHVELEVSAPFECGAMRCASRAIHREVVQHRLVAIASAVDGSSQALTPPPVVRQQPGPTSRPRESCGASKAIIRTRR